MSYLKTPWPLVKTCGVLAGFALAWNATATGSAQVLRLYLVPGGLGLLVAVQPKAKPMKKRGWTYVKVGNGRGPARTVAVREDEWDRQRRLLFDAHVEAMAKDDYMRG